MPFCHRLLISSVTRSWSRCCFTNMIFRCSLESRRSNGVFFLVFGSTPFSSSRSSSAGTDAVAPFVFWSCSTILSLVSSRSRTISVVGYHRAATLSRRHSVLITSVDRLMPRQMRMEITRTTPNACFSDASTLSLVSSISLKQTPLTSVTMTDRDRVADSIESQSLSYGLRCRTRHNQSALTRMPWNTCATEFSFPPTAMRPPVSISRRSISIRSK